MTFEQHFRAKFVWKSWKNDFFNRLTDGQKYANPRVKSGHWKPLRDGLQEGTFFLYFFKDFFAQNLEKCMNFNHFFNIYDSKRLFNFGKFDFGNFKIYQNIRSIFLCKFDFGQFFKMLNFNFLEGLQEVTNSLAETELDETKFRTRRSHTHTYFCKSIQNLKFCKIQNLKWCINFCKIEKLKSCINLKNLPDWFFLKSCTILCRIWKIENFEIMQNFIKKFWNFAKFSNFEILLKKTFKKIIWNFWNHAKFYSKKFAESGKLKIFINFIWFLRSKIIFFCKKLLQGHMSQVTGDITIFDFTDKYEVFEERRHGIDGCLYTFDEWQYEMFFKFLKKLFKNRN